VRRVAVVTITMGTVWYFSFRVKWIAGAMMMETRRGARRSGLSPEVDRLPAGDGPGRFKP